MASMNWRRTFAPADLGSRRVVETPGDIEDYEDREGYDPAFLRQREIPLPGLGAWEEDGVELDARARRPRGDPTELAYRNFSVKISRSRRLPLFSAVNIAGGTIRGRQGSSRSCGRCTARRIATCSAAGT
jgi:endonuclease G